MKNPPDEPAKKFRYWELMEPLSVPCPPDDFEPRETIAYRWVFEEMEEAENFLPEYLKHPKRFKLKDDPVKCQALGLSLFDDETSAFAQFEKLKRRMEERVWNLGTNLAKGTIKKDFGVACLPNEKGHFTLHPFEGIVLKDHFQIIAPL